MDQLAPANSWFRSARNGPGFALEKAILTRGTWIGRRAGYSDHRVPRLIQLDRAIIQ